MKRILCIVLALFLLLTAVGCTEGPAPTPNEGDTQETDTKQTENQETESNTEEVITAKPREYYRSDVRVVKEHMDWNDLEAKLIAADLGDGALNAERLAGENDGFHHLPLIRIDTMDQLNSLKAILRGNASSPTEFEKATEKMDADFMKYYSLFIVRFDSPSIGDDFEVRSISDTEKDLLTFNVVRTTHGALDAEGSWLAIIPLDTRVTPETAGYDAVLTDPEQISVNGETLIRVDYFDADSSFYPKAEDFYAESLNPQRLGVSHPSILSLPIFRFDTLEQLQAFNATYGELLDRRSQSNGTVTEATAKMDEAFFQTHSLIAVYVISGSGSYTFRVRGIEKANGTLTICIAQNPMPDGIDGTCDMAAWMAFVPIDRSSLANVTDFHAIQIPAR